MITRREVLIALGAGALIAPLASFAQQKGKVWRVGFLVARSRSTASNPDRLWFVQGMRDLGYVEGKNLAIEWRFADNKFERLPDLVAELVQLKVDVIVAPGPQSTKAAQKATTTIPIVMLNVGDPVGRGFIKSLAHPGGNITGLSNMVPDIGPKYLEILRSMVPKLSRVAVLVDPADPDRSTFLSNVQVAAQKTNVKILPVEARNSEEIERAFSVITRENLGAVIVKTSALFLQQQRQVSELAAKYRLPSVSSSRQDVEAGYLMSYGASADNPRRAATYVDKIFKGAKPGDLPVEQPTKFELVINGKTAKALGLTIPPSLLLSADKVIE